ncbi:hypothetical protein KC340_g13833 [Hortaea werneckii]|nr:hypothetical protein KC342_g14154 [Hortaea werneckii]KAI7069842.1 hypothetical protein KC339_g14741 [Hortaea werneckii]KAI7218834.1 hypothetical protein KC365_g12507 [Hortaea werneckii]KAI7299374.1 hypothetical protein KC340_g13833 [Hortaea werneckii]KAI7400662.1 hypothetical protein KC328_g3464 [Hortaea werneckii]
MNITRHLSSWYKELKLVVIKLTEDETTYILPRRMVYDMSEYFAKALEDGFEETQLPTLKLPDCSAETFDVVLGFQVYYGLPHDIKSEHQAQLLLVNLWLFGDTYLIPHLKPEAYTAASEILNDQPPCPAVLAKTLTSGPEDSPMRALFIEKATSCIIQGDYNEAERAELAEIEGFFKIMADGLADRKSSRAFGGDLAQEQGNNTLGPPAFNPAPSASARRRARRQANKASKS